MYHSIIKTRVELHWWKYETDFGIHGCVGIIISKLKCITHIALFKELNVCSLEEQWLVYSKFKNNKLIINDKPQSRWWRIILGYLNCKLSSTPSNEEVNHSVCRGNDTCKMKPFNIFGMTKQTTHGMKHSWCWSQLKVHKWIVMLSQVSPLIQAEWFFFFFLMWPAKCQVKWTCTTGWHRKHKLFTLQQRVPFRSSTC